MSIPLTNPVWGLHQGEGTKLLYQDLSLKFFHPWEMSVLKQHISCCHICLPQYPKRYRKSIVVSSGHRNLSPSSLIKFLFRSPEWKKINRQGIRWRVDEWIRIFPNHMTKQNRRVSYRTINQYGGTTCTSSFSRVNSDTIGCVWTGEFDWNTLCVDGEIFESGKKKLRIQKYPDRSGRDLSI